MFARTSWIVLLSLGIAACGGGGGGDSGNPPVMPTVELHAPDAVIAGNAATLSWQADDATSCMASGGWSGERNTSGTESTGPLGATTSYVLTCTGPGGTASDATTVTVTSPDAPTVSLGVAPTVVSAGSAATLTWSTTGATGCNASGGWNGNRATSGNESTGSLGTTTTFTLACTGPGGTATQSATVSVIPPPPGVSLAANPSTVTSGQSSTLTWNTTNADGCTASGGWSGARPVSGSEGTGALHGDGAYTLTCTGPGGATTRTTSVAVTPLPGALTISLTANPSTIASGAATVLDWSTTNATSCIASDGWTGTKDTSGSQATGNLTSTSTYTLTCTGDGGSDSRSVTVSVTPPAPTVTLSANPASVPSGTGATLTWNSGNANSCVASGGWTGTKATSGSQPTGNLSSTTTYTLTCTGDGGSTNQSATVTVTGAGGSIFPLRVEAGKRYLVTAQGEPFLIQGDAPWLLITNLTREEAVTYLDDRQAKGFNTLLVELIERNHSVNQPANIYGDPPFEAGNEFSPPVEAYFSHAEYVIAQARERGMLVLLTPSYMGFAGRETGWYPAMGRAGNAALREYGTYVATRFQAYDNILWVHGGDYNPPDRERLRAVVNGILDVETTSLHTFHGSRGTAALEWLGATDPWLDVNNIYTTKATVMAEARGEYERSTMPFFLIEGGYEDETATPTETRQQAWQAVLSGASGQVTGQESIWPFVPGVWPSQLDTEGASTLIHLRTLLESYAWWTLEPDYDNSFLTAGMGTGAARAPAARAADRSFAIIYVRDIRDLTIDMGGLAGAQVQARWYDPTNGTFATVAGSPFPATGSQVVRPTGNNSRGKTDWVLVLDAIP